MRHTAFEAESMPLASECKDFLGEIDSVTALWTALSVLLVDCLLSQRQLSLITPHTR